MNGAKILSKRFLESTFQRAAEFILGVAEKSGLWERGTYGTPMSEALKKLTTVGTAKDINGNFAYHFFKLK